VTNEQLQARVQELEHTATIDSERRAKLWATAKHWQERAEAAERGNAELRAWKDEVSAMLLDWFGPLPYPSFMAPELVALSEKLKQVVAHQGEPDEHEVQP
jgi:hypothetical protein